MDLLRDTVTVLWHLKWCLGGGVITLAAMYYFDL